MKTQEQTASRTVTRPSSFRLSPVAREALQRLAAREGLTSTGFLETTLRRLARDSGLNVEAMEAARMQSASSDTDDYWIQQAKEGRASGVLSAEETMRFIQDRLNRDEHQNGQA